MSEIRCNRLSLERATVVASLGGLYPDIDIDIAVPVIDGRPLHLIAGRRYAGLDVRLVAPPSMHWLGEPTYGENGRAAVLDGGCGEVECCGVMARISIGPDVVRWHDFAARGRPPIPDDIDFTFDTGEYRAVVTALGP